MRRLLARLGGSGGISARQHRKCGSIALFGTLSSARGASASA